MTRLLALTVAGEGSAMTASVSVAPVNAIGTGADRPLLEGQYQATADPFGNIDISDLLLVAAPGDYRLSVSLLEFPQVSLSLAYFHAALCLQCCHYQCCRYYALACRGWLSLHIHSATGMNATLGLPQGCIKTCSEFVHIGLAAKACSA